jgi:predicted RNase H-like HicB family nuclease
MALAIAKLLDVTRLRLTGVFWHEKRSVVSKCPELGVASCGDTVEEAMVNLREAVELYLENARLLGILDELPGLKQTDRFITQFEVAVR